MIGIKKYIAVALMLLSVCNAFSKQDKQQDKRAEDVPDTVLVNIYMDSLRMAELVVDSTQSHEPYTDIRQARMLAPFTFYRSVTSTLFGLTDTPAAVAESDAMAMRMYLSRPDLVKNTQTRVKKAGKIDDDVYKPLKHAPDFVEQMSPAPVEPGYAPVEVVVMRPNFWTHRGDYTMQFMQYCVSGNWYKGGESSYSMLGALTMEANYNNKQKVKWDNKLELRLGLQNTRSDSVHSIKANEDLIRFTSKLGLQATKRWYYTVQMIAYSQFMHSYKSNDRTVYSDFLAPLNLNLSIGMDYNADWLNHRIKGTVHLAPFAYNMKYTRLLELSQRLGIDEGKHTLHDFGSQLTADLTWQLTDILKWKSRLYAYTTYERMEFEWENTFALQISKWMTAQLFIHPRFDDGVGRDDHHGYWQFKEFSSIGFTYSF